MKLRRYLTKILGAASIVCILCSASALSASAAVDVVDDARSKWVVGEGYGGSVEFQDDGSIMLRGKSAIVTYTGARFLEEEITVHFKASLENEWAAIYVRNNINEEYLMDPDNGGLQGFPWVGRGYPFQIGLMKNVMGISQNYTNNVNPQSVVKSAENVYTPGDGKEHTLTFKVSDISDDQMLITVKYDGQQIMDYTETASAAAPMKEAGFLSFVCYNPGDYFHILSVEAPDGSVELTTDPTPTEPNKPDPTEPGNTDETEPAGGDNSEAAATGKPTAAQNNSSSGASKADDESGSGKADSSAGWVVWVVVGVIAAAAVAVAVIIIVRKKKKQA